jgi:hypothetical protein
MTQHRLIVNDTSEHYIEVIVYSLEGEITRVALSAKQALRLSQELLAAARRMIDHG